MYKQQQTATLCMKIDEIYGDALLSFTLPRTT